MSEDGVYIYQTLKTAFGCWSLTHTTKLTLIDFRDLISRTDGFETLHATSLQTDFHLITTFCAITLPPSILIVKITAE